jgi:hypothetical protein
LQCTCFLDNLYKLLYPDTRSCPQSNFCTVIIFWLRLQFVPRHCTSSHFVSSCTMTHSQSFRTLVSRLAYTPESLYHDGKNRAMLRSFRPQKYCTPILVSYSPASIRLRNVYLLYCRAVSCNLLRSCTLERLVSSHLDNE